MLVGFGKNVLKRRGRPVFVMAQLKRTIVEVKAEENCLAHALVIAIAKVENDPNYKAYRQGRKICHEVQTLLKTTGTDLSNDAGIPKFVRFQEYFREYKIVVYHGLSCEDIMFEGQVDIRSNNPQSAYALHILQNRHEYDPMHNTMTLLKHVKNQSLLLPYEQYHIQAHHHRKLIPEQSPGDTNPLFHAVINPLNPHGPQ